MLASIVKSKVCQFKKTISAAIIKLTQMLIAILCVLGTWGKASTYDK